MPVCLCVHACVLMHACMQSLRIVSMDRTLHFINTLVIILLQVQYSMSYRNGRCHEGAAVHLFLHASKQGHPLLCLERHLQLQQVHSVGHATREVLQSLTQLTAIQWLIIPKQPASTPSCSVLICRLSITLPCSVLSFSSQTIFINTTMFSADLYL